jgi:phosphomannomutase / phosphoglucomutase
MMLPREIFKAYDIRGIADKTLTEDIVEAIGRAIGSEAISKGQHKIAIGRDGRLSGEKLIKALARGLKKSGIDVIDVGCVTTPMVYFSAFHLDTGSAVMLTGSHNPPEYNGMKIVLNHETLYGDAIQALCLRIEKNDYTHGSGSYRKENISQAYIERIASGIRLARPMTITVDCGNGIAGAYAGSLYRKLGCKVHEMYCEVDGHFPHHHPDPSAPENLRDLIAALQGNDSEIGLAFDGDGDRLGVVAKDGKIIYPDRQLMLFAADVLSRNPDGEILFDVKCTRHLFDWIRRHRGKPLMWKTGHSLIKAKMKETGALLAGEMTGHLFFADRWYGFDDGLYGGARLLEILSRVENPGAEFDTLPDSFSTPELHVATKEGEGRALLMALQQATEFSDALEINTLDGLRVEYADGFGLLRASNTTPAIVLRFEADTETGLQRIQEDFRRMLKETAPHLQLPF